MFELRSVENRPFLAAETSDRTPFLFTTQFLVLISQFDHESVNFFEKSDSAANLCGKDANLCSKDLEEKTLFPASFWVLNGIIGEISWYRSDRLRVVKRNGVFKRIGIKARSSRRKIPSVLPLFRSVRSCPGTNFILLHSRFLSCFILVSCYLGNRRRPRKARDLFPATSSYSALPLCPKFQGRDSGHQSSVN